MNPVLVHRAVAVVQRDQHAEQQQEELRVAEGRVSTDHDVENRDDAEVDTSRAPNDTRTDSVLQLRRTTQSAITEFSTTKTAIQLKSARLLSSVSGRIDPKITKSSPISRIFSTVAADQTLP